MSIADVLSQCGYTAPEAERRRWDARLSKLVSLTARRDGPWLEVRAPLGDGAAADSLAPELVAGLLARQTQLRGGVKFTLADEPPRWFASAELPLDDAEAEAAAKIAPLCEGFRQAVGIFTSLARSQRPRAGEPRQSEPALCPLDPARRAVCGSIGWPLVERTGGEAAFELDVPGAYFTAAVQPCGETGLRLAVDLAVSQSPAEMCRFAAGVLLLCASHGVRMARATARTNAAATTYGWEASLEGVAGEFELRHALSALSVACRVSARPLEAIVQNEMLARSFLTLRDWRQT